MSSSVSRVLLAMAIYLGLWLPINSSGDRAASGLLFVAALLAVSRVYLLNLSPSPTVSSYLTHFTLTIPEDGGICFCGTFPKITSGCR